MASHGVVRRSILSGQDQPWTEYGERMGREVVSGKKEKESGARKTEEPALSTAERRPVSSGKASSGVYYYLFDDQRCMWATRPQGARPL